MSLAAVYCVYNEEEYLAWSIRSIIDAVDEVIVLLGEQPYSAYNANARTHFQRPDRSRAIVEELAACSPKIRLVTGVWDSELEHRNAGLRLCRQAGHAYYFLVDGDEVYRQDHLDSLRDELRARPGVGQFIIKCDLFWRSFQYRIPANDLAWMPRRVFKITRCSNLGKSRIPVPLACRFTGNNKTNSYGTVYHLDPQRVKFYHFSFARSPEKMREKLLTYSHAHEVLAGWYEQVWLRWPEHREMTNLNPVDPPKLPRAIWHDPADLPEVMRDHPYFRQEIIT
jgi:glycosyltransferase involved in cell wall biosynthesis